MASRIGQSGMALPLVVSLLLHLSVGALLVAVPQNGAGRSVLFEREEKNKEDEEKRLELGSATSTATTMTWIGYDEYEKHVAMPAEIDQAAFEPGAPSSSPSALEESPLAGEMLDSAAASEAQRPEESLADARPSDSEESDQDAPEAAQDSHELREASASELPSGISESELKELVEFDEGPGDLPRLDHSVREADVGPVREAPAEDAERSEEAQSQSLPETGESPANPSAPSGMPTKRGNEADRESVATSVLRAANQDLGKPLSSQGLEIQTVRPQFTYYTRLTAQPRNPLVVLKFDRHGRVQDVEIVRSTGNHDVDRNIRDAMYRWRARGKALDELSDDEPAGTVQIRIEIIL